MNVVLRLLLTLSSVSFFIVIYLLNSRFIPTLERLDQWYFLTIIVVLSVPVVLAKISLVLCKKLSTDKITNAKFIETSNNDFLANYLAFFFVALSVKDLDIFVIVFLITFLFTFYSRISYFNPVFLVYGFNFYYITTENDVKIMLITKDKLKKRQNFGNKEVKRINNYTFIEV